MKLKVPGLLIFLFIHVIAISQDVKIDSIRKVLNSSREDSSKVNTLLALSSKFYSSAPDTAIYYAKVAKELAIKVSFPKGEAMALKNIGIAYYNQGKYVETLDYWIQSLAVFDSIGDKIGVANINSNLGAIYFNQAEDAKALEYYLKSLQVSEDIGDKLRIATALQNIGAVYFNKKATHDKALQYYQRALPLAEEMADDDAIGSITVNMGEIYRDDKNDYDTAIFYFQKSLKALSNSEYIPYSLNAIGQVYVKKGNYAKAVENHKLAYEKAEKLNSKLDMAQSLLWLANAYSKQGNTTEALAAYLKSEVIAKEIGATYDLKRIYEGLSGTYAQLSDFNNAYKYQQLFSDIKDTLYNIETDKKLSGLQFNFEIEKKQNQIVNQEKDLKQQRTIRNATFGGLAIVLSFLVVVFFQKKKITKEKQRSEELLLNILPEETAEELKATGTAKAKSFDLVTVMFTDFKNFTQASEKLSAEELVKEINLCYSEFDRIITKYGIEKIKTIGDSYMCAGGLPVSNTTHPEDIIKAGLEMQDFISQNIEVRKKNGDPFFELRLGVHTGPVVAGIVGIKKFAYDIWGDTVNTASRMESSGAVGKVNISGTTHELVKNKFNFTYRGKIPAKNKGDIDMYFVESILN
ncbi:hypothetical protein BH11BAC2_BH11BAC2_04830 [soil metagenome]